MRIPNARVAAVAQAHLLRTAGNREILEVGQRLLALQARAEAIADALAGDALASKARLLARANPEIESLRKALIDALPTIVESANVVALVGVRWGTRLDAPGKGKKDSTTVDDLRETLVGAFQVLYDAVSKANAFAVELRVLPVRAEGKKASVLEAVARLVSWIGTGVERAILTAVDILADQAERAERLDGELAGRSKEASTKEAAALAWLGWMVQPFDFIFAHQVEFVRGPVTDLVRTAIKNLAPELISRLREEEVDRQVDEFVRGAGAASMPKGSPSLQAGWSWARSHGAEVRSEDDLPEAIRRQLVRSALADFDRRVTSQVVVHILLKAWSEINPANVVKEMITAIKRHGWKLGVLFALVELAEHFLLPAVLIWLTGQPTLVILGTLPLSEILYGVVLKFLGRAPKEVDRADPEGHLDWYERTYGPVRASRLAAGVI